MMAIKTSRAKTGKAILLLFLGFLLQGVLSASHANQNSYVWLANRLTVEQFHGDTGVLKNTLLWQTNVLAISGDVDTGLVWVMRKNGNLAAYDIQAQRKHDITINIGRSKNDDDDDDKGGGKAQLLARNNTVWLIYKNHLINFNAGVEQWRHSLRTRGGDDDDDESSTAISLDLTNNRLWLRQSNRIKAYSSDGALFTQFKISGSGDDDDDDDDGNSKQTFVYDNTVGRLIILSDSKLLLYSPQGKNLGTQKIRRASNMAVAFDGSVWLAHQSEIVKLASTTLQVVATLKLNNSVKEIHSDPLNPGLWVRDSKFISWVDNSAKIKNWISISKHAKSFTINYDRKPKITILSPKDESLVGLKPEFRVKASDYVGIDPTTFAITVNAVLQASVCKALPEAQHYSCTLEKTLLQIGKLADARYKVSITVKDTVGQISEPTIINVILDQDGDGIPDPQDTDRDGDKISNDYEVQLGFDPDDPNSTPPDLDGDGIPDSLDDDIDNDGYKNEVDAFPYDKSRWQLPAITVITAVQDNTAAQITWQPPANTENIHAYQLYRQQGANGSLSKLGSVQTALTFRDETVLNGTAYRYQVRALTQSGLEGAAGALASIFIAYNHTPITGLSANRQPVAVKLQWQGIVGSSYRVYRGAGNSAVVPLKDVNTHQLLDNDVLWSLDYSYQVASLLKLTNPLTQEVITVEGPLSEAVSVLALPPLAAELSDVDKINNTSWKKLLNREASTSITGTITEAIGAIAIIASSGSQQVNASSQGSSFRLVLPYISEQTTWSIAVSETTVPDRSVVLTLQLELDKIPPVVTIDQSGTINTQNDFIEISGTATDNSGSVTKLELHNNRFTNLPFGVSTANNAFSGRVQLAYGRNTIKAIAEDAVGNRGEATVSVERTIPEKPTVEISEPLHESVVTTERISVKGRVLSSLPANDLRIILGDQIIYPEAQQQTGIVNFNFSAVRLVAGNNTLTVRAESPAGAAASFVNIVYEPSGPIEIPVAPEIELISPKLRTFTREPSITVSGYVKGKPAPLSLTIDGVSVALTGSSNTQGFFRHLVNLTAQQGEQKITLIAKGGNNLATKKELFIVRDSISPQITITNQGIQSAPHINEVREQPYTLKGTVSDTHLAGLLIHGTAVELKPTEISATFSFEAALDLPLNIERTVELDAWDYAGNKGSHEVILKSLVATNIEIISPKADDTLMITANNASVEVVVRLSQIEVTDNVMLSIDNSAPVAMSVDGNIALLTLPIDPLLTEHVIIVTVLNAAALEIAKRSWKVKAQDIASIPLKVDRVEPYNNETGVEPNTPINVYFNRPIDPALLQISMRETVSGSTFDSTPGAPGDFPSLENTEPVEVHRNQEPVPGELAILPGNTVAVYHPVRDLAYGAQVYVDINYEGNELSRFNYTVRPIPTFIQGILIDQIGQAIVGVDVVLPDLGMSTVSDANGSYTFGFGLKADQSLPKGRHKIVFNPQMKASRFGEIIQWANVEAGRLNRLGATTLLLLNTDIPFRPIASGQQEARLAEGELILDLSNTQLRFPDGRDQGSIHVQLSSLQEISYNTLRSAMPQWLYAIQPAGIEVSGGIGVTIKMPALNGDHSYIPANDNYVVMIGMNPKARELVPVGVGKVIDEKVIATISALGSLDYLGYAIVDYKHQDMLKDFADGKINLSALILALESDL